MKLIIEISDKMLDTFKKHGIMAFDNLDEYDRDMIADAISNGTPLPKGHGDLIDRNALITELETNYHRSLSESGAHLFVEITSYIDDAETIIGADEENGG